MRFNLIGGAGLALQLSALHTLHDWFGLHYILATALGVEAAIQHNFWWHRAWTWRERSLDRPLRRLAHFHLGAGGVSLAGNLAGMAWLVGALGLPVLPANLCAIAMCALINFWLSERFFFSE